MLQAASIVYGAGTAGPTPPPAAAAVGYNTLTYGPAPSLNTNLFSFNFLNNTEPGGAQSQNLDGSLHLSGASGNTYNAGVTTGQKNTGAPGLFYGTAFGGGAYFECVFKFPPGASQPGTAGFPAFWALVIEHLTQNNADTWTGQYPPWFRYIELDFMEYVGVPNTQFKSTIHDWSDNGSTVNAANGATVTLPSGSSFANYNKYGGLWVPATSTSRGYWATYFNDALIRSNYSWIPFNSLTAPPVVDGTTLGNFLDQQHLMPILGVSSTNYPIDCQSFSVWQASGAGNLVHPFAAAGGYTGVIALA